MSVGPTLPGSSKEKPFSAGSLPEESPYIVLETFQAIMTEETIPTQISEHSPTPLKNAALKFLQETLRPITKKFITDKFSHTKWASNSWIRGSVEKLSLSLESYIERLSLHILEKLEHATSSDISPLLNDFLAHVKSGKVLSIQESLSKKKDELKNFKKNPPISENQKSRQKKLKDEVNDLKKELNDLLEPLKKKLLELCGIKSAKELPMISRLMLIPGIKIGLYKALYGFGLDKLFTTAFKFLSYSPSAPTIDSLRKNINEINQSILPSIQLLSHKVSDFVINKFFVNRTDEEQCEGLMDDITGILINRNPAIEVGFKSSQIDIETKPSGNPKKILNTAMGTLLQALTETIKENPAVLREMIPFEFLDNEMKYQIEYIFLTLFQNIHDHMSENTSFLTDIMTQIKEAQKSEDATLRTAIAENIMKAFFPDGPEGVPFYNDKLRRAFYDKALNILTITIVPKAIEISRKDHNPGALESQANDTSKMLCKVSSNLIGDLVLAEVEDIFDAPQQKLDEYLFNEEDSSITWILGKLSNLRNPLSTKEDEERDRLLPPELITESDKYIRDIFIGLINTTEENKEKLKAQIFPLIQNFILPKLKADINFAFLEVFSNLRQKIKDKPEYYQELIEALSKIGNETDEDARKALIENFSTEILSHLLPKGANSLDMLDAGLRTIAYDFLEKNLPKILSQQAVSLFSTNGYTGASYEELCQELGPEDELKKIRDHVKPLAHKYIQEHIGEIISDQLKPKDPEKTDPGQTPSTSDGFLLAIKEYRDEKPSLSTDQMVGDITDDFLPEQSMKWITEKLERSIEHSLLIILKNARQYIDQNYSDFTTLMTEIAKTNHEDLSKEDLKNIHRKLLQMLLPREGLELPLPPALQKAFFEELFVPTIIPLLSRYCQEYITPPENTPSRKDLKAKLKSAVTELPSIVYLQERRCDKESTIEPNTKPTTKQRKAKTALVRNIARLSTEVGKFALALSEYDVENLIGLKKLLPQFSANIPNVLDMLHGKAESTAPHSSDGIQPIIDVASTKISDIILQVAPQVIERLKDLLSSNPSFLADTAMELVHEFSEHFQGRISPEKTTISESEQQKKLKDWSKKLMLLLFPNGTEDIFISKALSNKEKTYEAIQSLLEIILKNSIENLIKPETINYTLLNILTSNSSQTKIVTPTSGSTINVNKKYYHRGIGKGIIKGFETILSQRHGSGPMLKWVFTVISWVAKQAFLAGKAVTGAPTLEETAAIFIEKKLREQLNNMSIEGLLNTALTSTNEFMKRDADDMRTLSRAKYETQIKEGKRKDEEDLITALYNKLYKINKAPLSIIWNTIIGDWLEVKFNNKPVIRFITRIPTKILELGDFGIRFSIKIIKATITAISNITGPVFSFFGYEVLGENMHKFKFSSDNAIKAIEKKLLKPLYKEDANRRLAYDLMDVIMNSLTV